MRQPEPAQHRQATFARDAFDVAPATAATPDLFDDVAVKSEQQPLLVGRTQIAHARRVYPDVLRTAFPGPAGEYSGTAVPSQIATRTGALQGRGSGTSASSSSAALPAGSPAVHP